MINGQLSTLNAQFLNFRPFEGGEYGGTYEGEKNTLYALIPGLLANGFQVQFETTNSLLAKLTFKGIGTSGTLGGHQRRIIHFWTHGN